MASLCASSSVAGRNSCSGGSSSRTVTGSPSMASRMPRKSSRWTDAQLLEGLGLLGRRVGQDHPPHHRQPVLAQEHVLGAAQADPLGAQAAGVGGVVAGVGVGPHGQVALADVVGPRQHGVERGGGLGRGERHLPGHHDAGPAVEGDPVPLVERDVARRHVVVAQAQHLGADHGRLAPAPGHDRGVADQAAARR